MGLKEMILQHLPPEFHYEFAPDGFEEIPLGFKAVIYSNIISKKKAKEFILGYTYLSKSNEWKKQAVRPRYTIWACENSDFVQRTRKNPVCKKGEGCMSTIKIMIDVPRSQKVQAKAGKRATITLEIRHNHQNNYATPEANGKASDQCNCSSIDKNTQTDHHDEESNFENGVLETNAEAIFEQSLLHKASSDERDHPQQVENTQGPLVDGNAVYALERPSFTEVYVSLLPLADEDDEGTDIPRVVGKTQNDFGQTTNSQQSATRDFQPQERLDHAAAAAEENMVVLEKDSHMPMESSDQSQQTHEMFGEEESSSRGNKMSQFDGNAEMHTALGSYERLGRTAEVYSKLDEGHARGDDEEENTPMESESGQDGSENGSEDYAPPPPQQRVSGRSKWPYSYHPDYASDEDSGDWSDLIFPPDWPYGSNKDKEWTPKATSQHTERPSALLGHVDGEDQAEKQERRRIERNRRHIEDHKRSQADERKRLGIKEPSKRLTSAKELFSVLEEHLENARRSRAAIANTAITRPTPKEVSQKHFSGGPLQSDHTKKSAGSVVLKEPAALEQQPNGIAKGPMVPENLLGSLRENVEEPGASVVQDPPPINQHRWGLKRDALWLPMWEPKRRK